MPDMETLLQKMVKGEKINKKVLDTPSIYMALVLSYEGLQLAKTQTEIMLKIEAHLAKLAGAVVERSSLKSDPENGEKVSKIRTTVI